MLFCTNCTSGLAKTNLGHLNGAKIFRLGETAKRAPSKYPMHIHLCRAFWWFHLTYALLQDQIQLCCGPLKDTFLCVSARFSYLRHNLFRVHRHLGERSEWSEFNAPPETVKFSWEAYRNWILAVTTKANFFLARPLQIVAFDVVSRKKCCCLVQSWNSVWCQIFTVSIFHVSSRHHG